MLKNKRIENSFKHLRKDISFIKQEICSIKQEIERLKATPFTLWFTGLPCSGKTTIAKRLKDKLEKKGYNIVHLDGDAVRNRLNEDLGFTKKDRKENLRRIAHVSQLFNDNGQVVFASFISPLNEYRDMIKKIIKNMKLIYVKCSVEECEKRDVKGMYKEARKGRIKNFTGVSDKFEEPKNPDLMLDAENLSVEECVDEIIKRFFLI